MQIKLDKGRKVELLKALQNGSIDPIVICRWFAECIELMTDEDLQFELDQIKKALTAADYRRIKTMAVCVGCDKWVMDNGRIDLKRLTNEELMEFLYLVTKSDPNATPEKMRNAKARAESYKGDTRFTNKE